VTVPFPCWKSGVPAAADSTGGPLSTVILRVVVVPPVDVVVKTMVPAVVPVSNTRFGALVNVADVCPAGIVKLTERPPVGAKRTL